ncbi:MAG: NAD-dependent DNA ligase LigA, partial [Cytophagales bacterium]
MEKNNDFSRMIELVEQLNNLNKEYYQNHRSLVSDFEFDQLLSELIKIESAHPDWVLPYSPSQRVGGTVTKNFKQVFHKQPMLSLSNTYNEQEIKEFDDRVFKLLNEKPEYVCEIKFDGVAISLNYENGILVSAVTRGDGEKGDEVTANVRTIANIPLKVNAENLPKSFEVRGEIYMPLESFNRINADLESSGKPLLANPRNAASGTLKMQDSKVVAQRGLSCFCYSLSGESLGIESHSQALNSLKAWGFPVSDTWQTVKSVEEIMAYINHWQEKRKKLPLDTDGVVVKVNRLDFQEILGMTAKSPRWAMAFKYKPDQACTPLLEVTYQVGRTGAVTPVAELKEVALSGTKVRRATLHNADEMQRLGLHEGDYVWVEKSGEIIPKITSVEVSKRQVGARPIVFVKNCPSCQTPLVRKDGEAHFFCTNEKGCQPQVLGRIEHFVSRDALNVDSVGGKTIQVLFEKGLVTTPADLFKLNKDQLLGLEGFKEKAAQNVIEGITKAKSMPFKKTLFALGIRFVGETVAEKLASYFKNITALRNATLEELIAVPEIGEKIAQSIVQYFKDEYYSSIVDELIAFGVNFESSDEVVEQVSDKLSGLSFVISGTFDWEREKIKDYIVSHGGKILSGVSGKLNYLVAGDDMGPSKLQKAQNLGVKIID